MAVHSITTPVGRAGRYSFAHTAVSQHFSHLTVELTRLVELERDLDAGAGALPCALATGRADLARQLVSDRADLLMQSLVELPTDMPLRGITRILETLMRAETAGRFRTSFPSASDRRMFLRRRGLKPGAKRTEQLLGAMFQRLDDLAGLARFPERPL